MHKNIRLEMPSMPLSTFPSVISEVSLQLANDVNGVLSEADFGGDSISEIFHTILRVFEKEAFEKFPNYYKLVAKKGRKYKAALITHNIYLEEVIDKDESYIYNKFLDCVIGSVKKLPEIKVKDVKVDELISALGYLRK